jgi:hypothetical protein
MPCKNILNIKQKKRNKMSSHNPNYWGGSNQEDCGLKPAGQIVCETYHEKYSTKKRAGRVAQVIEHKS